MTVLSCIAGATLILGVIIGARARTSLPGLWIQTAAVAAGAVVSATVLLTGQTLGSPFVDGIHPAVGLDPLSAFFLLVVTATALPVLVFATGYLADEPRRGAIGALTGAFIAAMVLVICSRDISTFLVGWEVMTLIPAIAIILNRADRPVRHAVFVYLSVTHLGGVGVWVCLIILSNVGALTDPSAFGQQTEVLRWTVWIGALLGFGVKAGLVPLHVWLPRAHPVAPSHLSALMSGVMLKVAIYGLVRVLFFWAEPVALGIAVTVVVIGALSALCGVIYALFQHELKCLLAFHSIENVGIITLGLGAALLFARAGQQMWASIAFAGALLHALNHSMFKSLLFLGAGAVQRATHRLGIDHLGGLIRRMPWTAAFFILGAMAISGLPPLNGFVSEWLTLQSLLHLALDDADAPWIGPAAAAALGATAALAVWCFVKVVGLVFLGRPRSPGVARAMEVGPAMRVGQGILAGSCVLLALLSGLLIPTLAGLRGVAVDVPTGLGLSLPGTGGLPMPVIALVLLAATAVLVLLRRGRPTSQPAPTWVCGHEPEPALRWTSAAFTKPLRLSWERVLRPVRQVTVHREGGITRAVTYSGEVPHGFDTKVYEPASDAISKTFDRARRLQSGRLRSYSIYLVVALSVLLLAARWGVGL